MASFVTQEIKEADILIPDLANMVAGYGNEMWFVRMRMGKPHIFSHQALAEEFVRQEVLDYDSSLLHEKMFSYTDLSRTRFLLNFRNDGGRYSCDGLNFPELEKAEFIDVLRFANRGLRLPIECSQIPGFSDQLIIDTKKRKRDRECEHERDKSLYMQPVPRLLSADYTPGAGPADFVKCRKCGGLFDSTVITRS